MYKGLIEKKMYIRLCLHIYSMNPYLNIRNAVTKVFCCCLFVYLLFTVIYHHSSPSTDKMEYFLLCYFGALYIFLLLFCQFSGVMITLPACFLREVVSSYLLFLRTGHVLSTLCF